MDFTQIRVPGAMILCITIAMIIAFGVPIALIIVWKKKTGSNLLSALCGAGTFIVFAAKAAGKTAPCYTKFTFHSCQPTFLICALSFFIAQS